MRREYTLPDLAIYINVAKARGELPDPSEPVGRFNYEQVWLASAEDHIKKLDALFSNRGTEIRKVYALILEVPEDRHDEQIDLTLDYIWRTVGRDKEKVQKALDDLLSAKVIGKGLREAHFWDPNLAAGHQWLKPIILGAKEFAELKTDFTKYLKPASATKQSMPCDPNAFKAE